MGEVGANTSTVAERQQLLEARIWKLVQRQVVFGYGEICAELSVEERKIRPILLGWVAEGKLIERPAGKAHRKMFELSRPYREPKDRMSIVAQQLWTAMRGLKSFDPVALASHSRVDLAVTLTEASSYCQSLLRGGYLKVVRTASPGVREATYRLIRDSGPLPPREKRVNAVWDPNDVAYAYVAGVGRIGGAR